MSTIVLGEVTEPLQAMCGHGPYIPLSIKVRVWREAEGYYWETSKAWLTVIAN